MEDGCRKVQAGLCSFWTSRSGDYVVGGERMVVSQGMGVCEGVPSVPLERVLRGEDSCDCRFLCMSSGRQ